MKVFFTGKKGTIYLLSLVYLFSIGVGLAVYLTTRNLISSPIWRMLIADVIATLIVWAFGLIIKNASAYDPYWSVIPPLIITGWIIIEGVVLSFGVVLLILAVFFWAIRLTYNWALNWRDFSHQDWRYPMIRQNKPELWFFSNLFGINMMPTLIVFLQMVPAYFLLQSEPGFSLWMVLGFLMSIAATLIQYISDRQMYVFREDHKNQNKCISIGLWKYSRHPNYFGEVLMWWGVWVMYAGAVRVDFLIIAPIMMTALFLFISIPMMEKKILMSRPEYQEYRDSVSMLVPFFPRKNHDEPSMGD